MSLFSAMNTRMLGDHKSWKADRLRDGIVKLTIKPSYKLMVFHGAGDMLYRAIISLFLSLLTKFE